MWKVKIYKDVDNDLLKLPDKLQAKMIRMLELIENHGAEIGEPHTKAFGQGLFELRAKAKEGVARALFCYVIKKEIVVLNVFMKKTQKTPKKEIELAKRRMLEVKRGLTETQAKSF